MNLSALDSQGGLSALGGFSSIQVHFAHTHLDCATSILPTGQNSARQDAEQDDGRAAVHGLHTQNNKMVQLPQCETLLILVLYRRDE